MASKVDIDGHATWVEDLDGSGAPLLLVHGGLSNSDALLGSIGRGLSESYRVVAFDRRGQVIRPIPAPTSTMRIWPLKPSGCWRKRSEMLPTSWGGATAGS